MELMPVGHGPSNRFRRAPTPVADLLIPLTLRTTPLYSLNDAWKDKYYVYHLQEAR